MNSILIFLENNKSNNQSINYSALDDKSISIINSWFSKYSGFEFDLSKAVELMLFLYSRENIDLYPVDEYLRIVSFICSEYFINDSLFLSMINDFRKMVYENTKQ